MTIVSLRFAVFVVATLRVYHSLPHRARLAWLLLVSYVFYALTAWRFVPVLALVTAVTFALGRRVGPADPAGRRWLWVGIAFNVAVLAALRSSLRAEPFAGPFVVVGLSFYALQAISYLLDVRSGVLRERGGLADVALYLAYFPKLVAGPIERAPAFLPRLARPHVVDDDVFGRALTLIVIGVTRKLVIADPLATLVPADAFVSPARLGSALLATALVAYAFVLYNDFAGYTSIVRGVSSLFGIELSVNFRQPFFARSFTEFWNRWHVTLSTWVRDYVYLPLSRALLRRRRSLRNVPNLIVPPMAALIASGVWHGAGLGFVLWGALHGMYLVGERLLALARPATPAQAHPTSRQLGAAAVVFVLGTVAFAAFRMDVATAIVFWRRLFRAAAGAWPDARMLPLVATSLAVDWVQYRSADEAAFMRWPRPYRVALAAVAVALWLVMADQRPTTPFIYQGF
jgi:alginate O-acetyltransferase complex protein AlgI